MNEKVINKMWFCSPVKQPVLDARTQFVVFFMIWILAVCSHVVKNQRDNQQN